MMFSRTSAVRRLEDRVRELEQLLGRKTVKILKEARSGVGKKPILLSRSLVPIVAPRRRTRRPTASDRPLDLQRGTLKPKFGAGVTS